MDEVVDDLELAQTYAKFARFLLAFSPHILLMDSRDIVVTS